MEGLGSNGQIVAGLTPYGATKRGLTYKTLAYQWLEQSLNTSVQAFLLIAAFLTLRAAAGSRARGGEPV